MIVYKEYAYEDGKPVDISKLETERMPQEDYKKAHESLVIATHDVIINYRGGILLVFRNNPPVKGILFPVGGRIEKGISIEESLKKKVKEECNLNLVGEIKPLGIVRTFFLTDPFGHCKGTDTFGLIFFARGEGELKIDNLHSRTVIIKPQDYTEEFRKSLHPYVRDYMDMAIQMIKK